MKQKKHLTKISFDKIKREIDLVIKSEIDNRFVSVSENPDPQMINSIIEEKNREVVKIYQQAQVLPNLPTLFQLALRIREKGLLFMEYGQVRDEDFFNYTDKKGRLEALLTASINAIEPAFTNLFHERIDDFDNCYKKAGIILEAIDQISQIESMALKSIDFRVQYENDAIAHLEKMAPWSTQIEKLRTETARFEGIICIESLYSQLIQRTADVKNSIRANAANVSKFIFGQALSVFRGFQNAKVDIRAVTEFMAQKEALIGYMDLFEAVGDHARKDQIQGFIKKIDAACAKIDKKAEADKKKQELAAKLEQKRIETVWSGFMEIRQEFEKGKFGTLRRQKKAVAVLEKYVAVLKSGGQRIKASEIERFIISAGLRKD
ncbi:hypothetical protein QUF76_12925, partial [Desulfobacterales bacterium HSG16]|nr:hypothetical protein [Desulfobacterales bacterium HSG16]